MKSIILMSILVFPLLSHAIFDVEDCSRNMKTLASREIQKAIDNGWSQIGNTTLGQIKSIVESENVKIWCGETPLKAIGERGSAYWQVRNGLHEIVINEKALAKLPSFSEYKGGLLLHEILGATQKLDDNNYQYSARIRRMGAIAFQKQSVLNQAPLKRGGGSNGVGGGGDSIDMAFKENIYQALEMRLQNDRTQFREMILKEFLDLELRIFRRNGAVFGPSSVVDTFDKNLMALAFGVNYVNSATVNSFLDSVIEICVHNNSVRSAKSR